MFWIQELKINFQFLIFFLIIIILINFLIIELLNTYKSFWAWVSITLLIKLSIMGLLFLNIIYFIYLIFTYYYVNIISTNYNSYNLNFRVDTLSLNIALLVALLFPIVFILADLDFGAYYLKYIIYNLILYLIIIIFLFCQDLCTFYIVYELIIMLVFIIMYMTVNSRGCVEAILFFAGWAVIGSFFVGVAILYIISVAGAADFTYIYVFNFTSDELYYLYLLFFFGFGTKLSTWPFWYWLPRAHVEVSTGMSIFLSCILIKICFYGLIRTFLLLNSDILIIPLIFFVSISVFDLVWRLIIQTDLKAITAYGSVLHVNLLILLFLLDTTMCSTGLIIYIWGHSWATAGSFYAINLIERCFGSRLTTEIAGIYMINPLVAFISIGALISFLEFPLCFFFWGEFWLWCVILDNMLSGSLILIFLAAFIYMIMFFRLWWGIIFGAPSALSLLPRLSLNYDEICLGIFIIILQFIIGLQPNIISFFVST